MKLIVIIDDNNGMSFNKRRQSRDKVLCSYILSLTKGKIYMSEYSAKLFSKYGDNIAVAEDISDIPDDAYCFIESISPSVLSEKIDHIYLFRWNRLYPADVFFDIELSDLTPINTDSIKGSSHDDIVLEEYMI